MSILEFRPLTADDVECRVAQCSEKGVSVLLYKDARVDMRLLDETIGAENWQCDYKTIDGKMYCGIGCRFKDGEWVWKWDTGTPSNMESQKGEASDAFKRAGFKWGIGRELYTAPFIWVPADKCKKLFQSNGKWKCYDDFRVADMAVDDGRIMRLQICNASNRMVTVYGQQGSDQLGEAKKRLWSAISRYAELSGHNPNQIAADLRATEGWQETPEYINAKAELFEADCNVR